MSTWNKESLARPRAGNWHCFFHPSHIRDNLSMVQVELSRSLIRPFFFCPATIKPISPPCRGVEDGVSPKREPQGPCQHAKGMEPIPESMQSDSQTPSGIRVV